MLFIHKSNVIAL